MADLDWSAFSSEQVWAELLRDISPDRSSISNLLEAIADWIDQCERCLSELVGQILSAPSFRRLEANWLSLASSLELVNAEVAASEYGRKSVGLPPVRLFVLDISVEELTEDLDARLKSQELYRKLHDDAYDRLIGQVSSGFPRGAPLCFPLSLIVLAFPVKLQSRRPMRWSPRNVDAKSDGLTTEATLNADRGLVGIETLSRLCAIAQRCFCMILGGVAPESIGNFTNSNRAGFENLGEVSELGRLFKGSEFQDWQDFQKSELSRWAGLALPQTLQRRSWEGLWLRQGFRLKLSETSRLHGELWGNGAFSLLEVFVRAQVRDGWYSDAIGIERDTRELPVQEKEMEEQPEPAALGRIKRVLPGTFALGGNEKLFFPGTDYAFSVDEESIFSNQGLLPLYASPRSGDLAILSGASSNQVEEPRLTVGQSWDTRYVSRRLSAMFHNMLCVCKLAHCLKFEIDRFLGGSSEVTEVQAKVTDVLSRYMSQSSATGALRRQKPFSDPGTTFTVIADEANPGKFDGYVELCLHSRYYGAENQLRMEPIRLDMGTIVKES